jgi:hypothetical protein
MGRLIRLRIRGRWWKRIADPIPSLDPPAAPGCHVKDGGSGCLPHLREELALRKAYRELMLGGRQTYRIGQIGWPGHGFDADKALSASHPHQIAHNSGRHGGGFRIRIRDGNQKITSEMGWAVLKQIGEVPIGRQGVSTVSRLGGCSGMPGCSRRRPVARQYCSELDQNSRSGDASWGRGESLSARRHFTV